MMRLLRAILGWTEERSGAVGFVAPIMTHRVPRDAKWWYVFGSATLMFFCIQIASGVLLATLYAPSAADAYQSLQYIDAQVPNGGGAHEPGVPARQLQVPARTHVDGGRAAAVLHAGAGVHRPDHALGPGRLLGPGHRGQHRRPRAGDGQPVARHPAGRALHRGRHAQPLLRAARVRAARAHHRAGGPAHRAHPEGRRERDAEAGHGGRPRHLSQGIRGARASHGRAVLPRCGPARHGVLRTGADPGGRAGGLLRAVRSQRQSRSHHH
ncbi:MAG: hypothetical protein EBU85_07765 [Actinobacteria bacterium]|nr:hypothetical protein [Actinomycetota bacterium]